MKNEQIRQIYLNCFPLIIGKRMAEQYKELKHFNPDWSNVELIYNFNFWDNTKEDYKFWNAIKNLYESEVIIEDDKILKIFNQYNIKP